MKHQIRSAFHFVLLFIFIYSQVMVVPASAAGAGQTDEKVVLQKAQPESLSEAMPVPAPAEKGSVTVSADRFKPAQSSLEIAAKLNLLGYTLPAYPVYQQQNGLSIEPLVAYNLIVDSNVLSPSSYGPSTATFGAKFCNTNTTGNLTNVSAYIGNYDSDYLGTPGDATPGFFPQRSEAAGMYDPATFAAAYGASTTNPLIGSTLTDYGLTNTPFALQLASGTTPPQVDATRYIGTLTPGQCKTEYWVITYPRKACSSGTVCDTNNSTRKDVTGGVKPEDDLWLPYFFWGTSTSGSNTATSYRWNAVTMRNEISAMANKIWPNGDNKVPDEYAAAIAQLVGWDTWTSSGTSTVYPGDTVISEGIWYDLGNVGAGFDNNGDFVPDRNIWVQPIGDASGYDPGCFRLVRTYGLIIVKLNDGTEQLIPFVDQMYFENIPDNNNGAIGLVYYQYAALDGVCTASLTPYQEVASGYDNEKFNADYGAGIPPLQSQESNMTLDKTGQATIGLTGTISYSLTFTLPDINTGTNDTVIVGQPSLGAPLTFSDAVPVGLQYVACSAFRVPPAVPPSSCTTSTLTVDMSANYAAGDIPANLWHSKDGGATWIMGDPGTYTSSSTSNQLVLQWRLQSGVASPISGAAYTGTVTFQAVIPGTYTPVKVDNEACLKIGQGPGFVCDPHTTVVTGNSSITGLVWRDDAILSGVLGNAVPDGTEAGIPSVKVDLYWDNNGDGDYADTGDFLYATTNSVNYSIVDGSVDVNGSGSITLDDDATLSGVSIIDGGLDLNGDGAVNATDAGFFGGYTVINGRIDRDGTGTITTTDDGSLVGVYNFGRLPATTSVSARYIIVVDPRDSDIPTGYGPTTPTSYPGINLAVNTAYGDAANTSEPSDFGFAPALSLDKTVMTSTSITVGDMIEYRIAVQNNLPGDGSGGNACVYNTYATSEGSRSVGVNYVDSFDDNGPGASPDTVTNVFTAPEPDGLYAVGSYKASGTQILDGVGFSMGPQAGTITNVKARVKLYIDQPFNPSLTQADYGAVEYWAGAGPTKYAGTLVGTQAEQNATKVELEKHVGIANAGWYELNLGATNPATGLSWTWADLAPGNSIHISYQAGKQADGDQVLIYIDAIGLQVSTNGTCSAASATLNPVPLTDTFDDVYFDYISADPPPSTIATGTLTWNNVGPLYPGQTRFITVYMRAVQVGSSPATVNTATSTNSKFVSGLPANSPVSDTAAVAISANTNTRSLIGRVFDDNNVPPNGWQTPLWTAGGSGFDAGDVGIQYIPVDLYGCVATATNTLIVDEGSNKTCADQGGTWHLLKTASTDPSGDYAFNNLAPGYYRVNVRSSVIVGSQTADVNAGGLCTPSCDSWSNSASDYLSVAAFVGDVDEYTAVTRVNFGYNVPSGAYDIGDLVFYDWDGDGVQDAEDEPMPNVTLRLLAADGTALTMTNTTGNYYFLDRSPAYYTVEVVASSLPAGVVQTKDPDSIMDNKSTFALTADKLDVDFGYRPYGSGTIGDTVFKDINGNGVQDGTGETGLAGIAVQLQVDWDGNGTYITIKTATTDSSGKYLFTDLPVGSYRVSINLGPNAAAIPDDLLGNNYFPSNGTNTGSAVYMDKTLTALAPNNLTADFGFAPPASIGDTVYQDVNRNGTQDTGEPGINGITVTLYTYTDSNSNSRYDPGESVALWTTTTTATATYRVMDGKMDVDGNGSIDTNDDGTVDGCIVADGLVTGGCSSYKGFPLVSGYIDVDRDGVTSGDTGDDLAPVLGEYRFTGLTPNPIGYGYVVGVTPPSGVGVTLTGDPSMDGVACPQPVSGVCDHRDGMRLYNGTNYTGADFGYYVPGALGDTLWIDTDNDGVRDATEVGIDNVTVRLCADVSCTSVTATTVTDANGNYFFTGISNGTYYVVVDTSDTDLTGLGVIQTFERNNGGTADNDPATAENVTQVVLGTVDGSTTVTSINGTGCTNCNLDLDFGYRYAGIGNISGTICLETTTDGVCGDSNADTSGVGTGEAAYDSVTVYLYKLNDMDNDGVVDPGETTVLVSSTVTNGSGDYSFTGIASGVYYIVAIGAPQDGLDLTSSATVVNDGLTAGSNNAETTSYVETTAFDGDTLSAYQVVKLNVGGSQGDNTAVDRDFAFKLDGNYDFGDLPQGSVGGITYGYSTLLEGAPDGPRHLIPATPSLYLGTGVDIDTNGFSTSTLANADTEENGVTIGTDNNWGDGSGQLNFDITGSGWLVGWIDFNADGDFSDTREVVINQAVSGDLMSYSVTTPYNGTTVLPPIGGYLYARFRLFASQPAVSALAYIGETSNGEVEDYRFPITPAGLTNPVTVSYFHARRHGSTVNFEWSTETETGNIGFNLYVDVHGGLIQVNEALIPSRVIDSLDRQDYSFSIEVGGDTFYIEDVSILGETRQHGPFLLGEEYGERVNSEKTNWFIVRTEERKSKAAYQAQLKSKLVLSTKVQADLKKGDVTSLSQQLAATSLNLKVNKTGIYRVTYEALQNAGLDLAGAPSSKIALTNHGQSVPIYVEGKGKFGPGSFIEFYGEALDTIYTDVNIYTIQVSTSPAPRIQSDNAAVGNGLQSPTAYLESVVVNRQRTYANFAPGDDAWYDTSMNVYKTPQTWSYTFSTPDLVNSSTSPTLELVVWGVTSWADTNPDHHLRVSLNNVFLAEQTFDGLAEKTIKLTLSTDVLKSGTNVLQLTVPGDTGAQFEAIILDKFTVVYPRVFSAQNGVLKFTAAEKAFKVTNLPTEDIVVYRMHDTSISRIGKVTTTAVGNTYTVTFAGANELSTYLITSVDHFYTPVIEAVHLKADLAQPAEYLVISHPDFIKQLQPLIQARQAQGLTVSVVDVNDIYAQYSYGIFDPEAIKRYIAYAAENLGTRYIVLIGGDTYDYRNYLGKNTVSFIPSLYATTSSITQFVPVDPLYTDINGDNVPDLAIGRFPVRTQAEMQWMLNKTLAYAAKDYQRTAVFIADKNDGYVSFRSISDGMASKMPSNWQTRNIYLSEVSAATARQQLIGAMNKGTALVTFTGHSGTTTWTLNNLFTIKDAEALTNTGRPFVTVQWGCWNTYYVDPTKNYLVQGFLVSGDKGAAAVFGSATRTDLESEQLLGELFTPKLVTPGMTIGQALQDAKAELAQTHPELFDVLLGWSLMGDPALVVQP